MTAPVASLVACRVLNRRPEAPGKGALAPFSKPRSEHPRARGVAPDGERASHGVVRHGSFGAARSPASMSDAADTMARPSALTRVARAADPPQGRHGSAFQPLNCHVDAHDSRDWAVRAGKHRVREGQDVLVGAEEIHVGPGDVGPSCFHGDPEPLGLDVAADGVGAEVGQGVHVLQIRALPPGDVAAFGPEQAGVGDEPGAGRVAAGQLHQFLDHRPDELVHGRARDLAGQAARAAPASAAHVASRCSMPAMVASSSSAAAGRLPQRRDRPVAARRCGGPAVEVVSDMVCCLSSKVRGRLRLRWPRSIAPGAGRSIAFRLLGQQPVGGGGDEGLDPRFSGPRHRGPRWRPPRPPRITAVRPR